jgi:uracil-DNA glycosylase
VSARHLERWAPQEWKLAPGWQPVVDTFLASDAGRQLAEFMGARIAAGAVIYPPRPLRALEVTPLAQVHAVILGQDPYHGPGQAGREAAAVAAQHLQGARARLR